MKRITTFSTTLVLSTVLALAVFASPSNAVSTTYVGLVEGFVVHGTSGPSEQAFIQSTSQGKAYRLSTGAIHSGGDTFNETSFAGGVANASGGHLSVNSLGSVSRIVRNSYPNENPSFPLLGNNFEQAAAIQAAIWKYTNNWELDTGNPANNAVVISNYNLIRGWMDGNPGNGEYPAFSGEPSASLSVDSPTASLESTANLGPFTVQLQGASAFANVTATNGVLVDQSNVAIDPSFEFHDGDQFYIRTTTPTTAFATVSGQANAPVGRVFVSTVSGQAPIINVSEFSGTSSATASAVFVSPNTVTRIDAPVGVQGAFVNRVSRIANSGFNDNNYLLVTVGSILLLLGFGITSLTNAIKDES